MVDYDGLVLVLGANGQTGVRTVEALRAKEIPVRAMVRGLDKASELGMDGVEVIVGNVLDEHDLANALNGTTVVISTLGTRSTTDDATITEIEVQAVELLIRLAREADVQHIILCSSMGTEMPQAVPPLAKVLEAKRRGEMLLENCGIPYTIVRPGGLTNDEASGQVLISRRLQSFGRISRGDVAEVLVQAVLQPEARNKIVEIIAQPGASAVERDGLFRVREGQPE
jgi:uncharacterized protein YbjT (DUF2867 family)